MNHSESKIIPIRTEDLDLKVSGGASWKEKIKSSYPCTCGHAKLIHATEEDQKNPYGVRWHTCLYFSETDTGHSERCKCEKYVFDNLRYLEEQDLSRSVKAYKTGRANHEPT